MKSNQSRRGTTRHLIAAYTFIVLLPLVYFIPPWLQANIIADRLPATVLALAIIVPVVSYIALPLFFKIMPDRSQ